MESLRGFSRLMSQAPKGLVAALLVLVVLSSATDGIGFLLLVPLLGLMGGDGQSSPLVGPMAEVLQFAGIPLTTLSLLTAFVALVAARSVIEFSRGQVSAHLQHILVDQLRLKTYAALLGVEWRWLNTTRRSDHANLLLTNISRIGNGLSQVINLLATLAAIVAYLSVALFLSPAIATLVIVSGGGMFWLLAGHRRQAFRLGQDQTIASRALQGNIEESLAGIKLSKILGTEQRHLAQLSKTMKSLREHQLRFVSTTGLSRGLFQFFGAVLLAGYIYVGLEYWHVAVPEMLTLVLIFSRLVPLFMTGQQQSHFWTHALPALYETEELLEQCRAAAEPVGLENPTAWPVNTAIDLVGVSITYGGRDVPAVQDITLSLPGRTTTAVMGPSGAGKSTLADIVMGLLSPDTGAFLIDGVPVVGAARDRWRKSVAYVPQDTVLFHDTIENNLLWGKSDASPDELRIALTRAAADFVFDLPQGLQTQVGDGGLRLSGGERQRLALARALLRRPSLLILDEATSALDVANESRIRGAIEKLHGDLTVLIIGHRLPTLEHADQVVLMDAGRVVAKGTWAEVRPAQVQSADTALL